MQPGLQLAPVQPQLYDASGNPVMFYPQPMFAPPNMLPQQHFPPSFPLPPSSSFLPPSASSASEPLPPPLTETDVSSADLDANALSLHDMFPAIDSETIREILVSVGGSVDQTVQMLLEMGVEQKSD